VNVRVVAATNADLAKLVKDGGSASTSTTGSTPTRSTSRRCASARTTSRRCRRPSWKSTPRSTASAARLHRQGQAGAALLHLAGQHPRAAERHRARVILAPHGTRVEAEHLFLAERDGSLAELGLDAHGDLARGWQPGEKLCESVLNGVFTLDEVESMLLEAAVAKAKGNLSGAARLLGITRPQLAYRLKRMSRKADKRPAKNSVAA
jgi:hypothetical protein